MTHSSTMTKTATDQWIPTRIVTSIRRISSTSAVIAMAQNSLVKMIGIVRMRPSKSRRLKYEQRLRTDIFELARFFLVSLVVLSITNVFPTNQDDQDLLVSHS